MKIIFVNFLLIISVTSKQALRSEGAFDGDTERSIKSIERGKASEERINLSFPG